LGPPWRSSRGGRLPTDTSPPRYLARSVAGVPRDLVQSAASHVTALRPTVFIFNCTWVCDAKCTMCNNWKWGNRKEDITLDQLDRVMDNGNFWHPVENLNIPAANPTPPPDLPEMGGRFHRRLPRRPRPGIRPTGSTTTGASP